jgi:hypothetical protein
VRRTALAGRTGSAESFTPGGESSADRQRNAREHALREQAMGKVVRCDLFSACVPLRRKVFAMFAELMQPLPGANRPRVVVESRGT